MSTLQEGAVVVAEFADHYIRAARITCVGSGQNRGMVEVEAVHDPLKVDWLPEKDCSQYAESTLKSLGLVD